MIEQVWPLRMHRYRGALLTLWRQKSRYVPLSP